MVLKIDLQNGFVGDPVVVRVDGHEVFRGEARTRRTIGKAASVVTEIERLPARVDIDISSGRLRASALVSHPFLGVSLAEGDVRFTESDDRFGYA